MLETHSVVVFVRTLRILCCRHTLCTETKLGETPPSACSSCSWYRCGTWCIAGTNCGSPSSMMPTSIENQGTFSCRVSCCIWSTPGDLPVRRISYTASCLEPWSGGRRSTACTPCTSRSSCSGCGKQFRALSCNAGIQKQVCACCRRCICMATLPARTRGTCCGLPSSPAAG